MAHAVVRFDEKTSSVPPGYARHARGYHRTSLIDHATSAAALHMADQIVQLDPGGALEQNVLAYEKSLYVFEGELDLMLDGRAYRLVADDYALILVGSAHALRSGAGARWMEMIAPQPLAPSVGQDTFSVGDVDWPAAVERFDRGDARTRFVGHFSDGQLPPPGNLQMDGYSGDGARLIRQKMMVDRNFGSAHLTMFVVEFAPGGGGSHHTHPFEESYFFVGGTADCVFEGSRMSSSPERCAGPASEQSIRSSLAATWRCVSSKRRHRSLPRATRSASIASGARCASGIRTRRRTR